MDDIFASDRALTSLALTEADCPPTLVDRIAFEFKMSSRHGYGRMVYGRRPIREVAELTSALVLPANTSLAEACRVALERPDGSRYRDLLVWEHGEPARLVSVSHLLETLAGMYAHQARVDPLTGLANRTELAEQIERAVGAGPDGPRSSLLFIDLDRFKVLNDSLGHRTGDDVLRAVAARLATLVAPPHLLARLGGDEFAMLLPGVGDPSTACEFARRVQAALALPFSVCETPAFIGASVGVAVAEAGDDADALLRKADLAMYRAKERGRGQYSVFRAALGRAADERLRTETELRLGLQDGQIHAHYQPIVRLADGALAGFEALARWEHPDRGLISPAAFLPLADEIGVMPEIDACVARSALEQFRRWDAVRPGLDLSLNVTPQQVGRPNFADRFLNLLDAAGVAPSSVILEVTESGLMTNIGLASAQLTALRATGLRIAIDDFGTGYSSLTQLRNLPVDRLKVDRSFISGIPGNAEDSAIVELVLALGKAMQVDVVAEGVETRAQADYLRAASCRLGQGAHWAMPLAPGKALEWVAQRVHSELQSAA